MSETETVTKSAKAKLAVKKRVSKKARRSPSVESDEEEDDEILDEALKKDTSTKYKDGWGFRTTQWLIRNYSSKML